MPTVPRIAIVVASTRATRFAEIPLKWILDQASARTDLAFDVIDLRDYPLPYFELAGSPAMTPRQYTGETHEKLGKLLDAADGFLFLANEYNHGYSAALKNTL